MKLFCAERSCTGSRSSTALHQTAPRRRHAQVCFKEVAGRRTAAVTGTCSLWCSLLQRTKNKYGTLGVLWRLWSLAALRMHKHQKKTARLLRLCDMPRPVWLSRPFYLNSHFMYIKGILFNIVRNAAQRWRRAWRLLSAVFSHAVR